MTAAVGRGSTPAVKREPAWRIRFAVLDLLSEDAFDLFEVADEARRAVAELDDDAFAELFLATVRAMINGGLVCAVDAGAGQKLSPATLPSSFEGWRYEALGATTPKLAIEPAGRELYWSGKM